jgi:parallel beta-helix repeat protein
MRIWWLIPLLLMVVLFSPFADGKIIYVDDDGPADFSTIQAAIDDANDGDTVVVAPGTYTGEGNRDIDFKGKAITVKSEDGPQTCIIDCQGTEDDPHRGFYFHSGEDTNSILQGFTVTNGYIRQDGGAIYCNMSSPSIINCIISNNNAIRARVKGGGIALIESEAHIIYCVVRNNIARQGNGGGIYISNNGGQIPRITRCIISGNTAIAAPRFGGDGGGVALFGNGYLLNCVITGNRAGYWGGGICCSMPYHQGFLSNSIVWANICTLRNDASQLTISTCNYDDEVFTLTVENSIIADSNNNDGIYILSDNSNCITGSWLTIDPLFIKPGYWEIEGTLDPPFNTVNDIWIEGDYHLKSQAGRWDPDSQSWEVDIVTSPCIDAGDPNVPVSDEPEPNGSRINMGAYGGTPQASKSYILTKTIYVDDDAIGTNDGTRWENAYTFLQDALIDANDSEKPVEIRVAQGTYKPNQGIFPIIPAGVGGRSNEPYPAKYPADLGNKASFNLINDVTIKGGYAGLWESDPNVREIELYETILSGDLNGDDIEVNDPCDLRNEPTRHENSDRIVNATETDATTVLDGLTVTAGFGPFGAGMGNHNGNPILINCTFKGNTAYHDYGGGLLNGNGNPTLINCTFTKNYGELGGGMCSIRSSPTLTGCVFTGNYAELGAGLCNMKDIPKGNSTRDNNSTLIDCTFIDNNARFRGGGMYNGGSDSNLSNCTFSGNSSLLYGAGIYNRGSNHIIIDSTFSENKGGSGGGIYSKDNSSLIVTNCTFRNNIAIAVFGGGICNEDANELVLTNCTFNGNTAKRAGGGIFNRRTNSTLKNCILTGNKACGELIYIGEGGGLYAFGDTKLDNCTFSGNWAHQGRAINKYSDSFLKLKNCILWNGGDEILDLIPNRTTLDISYSNINNGWEGKCNINEDPLFANPGYWADAYDPNIIVEPNNPNAVWIDGDYHLKSQAGRWDPVSESWIQDDVTSPCIDAGDPNSPIGHEPFPSGGIINMGAYGGTPQASKSITDINGRF